VGCLLVVSIDLVQVGYELVVAFGREVQGAEEYAEG
jgi:hypothetical protein